MKSGKVEVICGNGVGKTSLAVGKGVVALTKQQNVIIIQFLKGSQNQEGLDVLKCMEPQFKVFRFEKADTYFENLSEEEKQEELINIRNGFNFAKKVVATGECDLLILDEVLSVGDGAFQEKSAKKMREIIDGGAATILVSHSLGQIRELCNKVLWLHRGRQIEFGEAGPVCDRYKCFLAGGCWREDAV